MTRLLKEPFALFVLLGIALFATDRLLNGAPRPVGDEGRSIVVTTTQQQALRDAFRAERGREPDAAEIQAQLNRWIEEQVLYREALALNLDRKDLIVHRQLTQKMRFLLEDSGPAPTPTEADLQTWLDQHPQHYGHAATISFEQVFLSRGHHGDALQAQATKVAAQLQSSPESFLHLGDPLPTGQIVSALTAVQLRREFGPDFAAAVQKLSKEKWAGPIASGFGLHFVRITASSEFTPATLAEVRTQLLADYQIEQREISGRKAVDRLKLKYRLDIEPVRG